MSAATAPLLSAAAESGDVSAVRTLLQERYNHPYYIETINSQGETPLMTASRCGHIEVARLLLDHGADVNAQRGFDHFTPLHFAIQRGGGDQALAELLISRGARLNAGDDEGFRPLTYAIWKRDGSLVRMLLARGAGIDEQDRSGFSVLCRAVQDGSEDMVRLLLELGARVDVRNRLGKTALDIAEEEKHEGIVKMIRDHMGDDANDLAEP
ncbi:ankyrin repeat-containing domain protein [Echria macrotheca]|uniref:Ankyrin repeat-containing domain protein n=1 Tax=Echria macrotheca TaxID=438768 RepID=A0AAJ0BHC8_9PEZI|nr:ankyrin repeat-containing domain protein [Echria macrotheca]